LQRLLAQQAAPVGLRSAKPCAGAPAHAARRGRSALVPPRAP
jgi:hypothetical protein